MKISCYTEALIQDERFSRIGLRVQGLSSLGLRNFRSLTRLRARNEREIEDVACLVLYVSEAAHTIIQNHVTGSLNYSTWHIDEVCRAASSCPLTKNMCSWLHSKPVHDDVSPKASTVPGLSTNKLCTDLPAPGAQLAMLRSTPFPRALNTGRRCKQHRMSKSLNEASVRPKFKDTLRI